MNIIQAFSPKIKTVTLFFCITAYISKLNVFADKFACFAFRHKADGLVQWRAPYSRPR